MSTSFLPGAGDELRERVAVEIARLRVRGCTPRKFSPEVDSTKVAMSYFSRQAVARPLGRPLGQPVQSFAAALYARLTGHSRKRAAEILAADPVKASGAIWAVASRAHADGVTTVAGFDQWLQSTEERPDK